MLMIILLLNTVAHRSQMIPHLKGHLFLFLMLPTFKFDVVVIEKKRFKFNNFGKLFMNKYTFKHLDNEYLTEFNKIVIIIIIFYDDRLLTQVEVA